MGTPAYFGSAEQVAILSRGHALHDVLKGDGRFSCHGRVVGLVSPDAGDMALVDRLARVQGASHYARVGPDEIDAVLAAAEKAGLQPTNYRRWEIEGTAVDAAAELAKATPLPEGLTIAALTPGTPAEIVASFAETSLCCGVLPAWHAAHSGQALRARSLLAVTPEGRVAASAYAAEYISDGSDLARHECFWGMLATAPEWRGRRLSILLGGRLLGEMRRDFGFGAFYTGITPGNAPSEAVCERLGLRWQGNAIVSVVDVSQLPGGRMSK